MGNNKEFPVNDISGTDAGIKAGIKKSGHTKDNSIKLIDFDDSGYFLGGDPVGEEMACQKYDEAEILGKRMFELKNIFAPQLGLLSTTLHWNELPASEKTLWMNIANQVLLEQEDLIPKKVSIEVNHTKMGGCYQ